MTALSGGENTALALINQDAPVYLTGVTQPTVATATVATSPTTFPIIEIATSGESAGWTNMKRHQTVVITNDIETEVRGYYYVREPTGTGSLQIGEVANGDPGLVAIGNRQNAIISGDLITILERSDLHVIKPYMDSSLTIYQGRTPVGTYNTTPFLAAANVTINGQPGHDYAALVANGATKAMTLVITPIKWPTSSGSTITYAWTGTGSWSGVSGGATATLTGTAPVGAYHLYCTVNDSIGGATLIECFVRIHSPADPPALINVSRDTRDAQSRRMSVRMVNARQAAIPPAGRVIVWSDGTWGGSDVASASKSFSGFVTNKVYSHVPAYYEGNIDIAGPMAILMKRRGYASAWTYNASPSTWEHLPASLCNYYFLMWWLLQWRVTNFHRLFNFTPFNVTGTTKRRRDIAVAPGYLGQQLRDLAGAIDMNIGSRSEGTIKVAPIPSLRFDRSGQVTRGALPNTTYQSIKVQMRTTGEVGTVMQNGYVSDLSADTQVASIAPALKTAGMGGGDESKQDRVWDSQQDCNQQTGLLYAMLNNDYETVTATIPNNHDVFEPVDMELVTATIPSDKSPTGAALSLTTVPTAIDKTWITGRRASIGYSAEVLTYANTTGETKPIEVPQTDLYNPYVATPPEIPFAQDFGAEDTNPEFGESTPVPAIIGATIEGYVWVGVSETEWKDISPTADQRALSTAWIKLILDPWNYKRAILYGDGGVLVCNDITASAPTWTFYSLTGSTTDYSLGTPTLVDTFSMDNASATYSTGSYVTNPAKTYKLTISGTFAYHVPSGVQLGDPAYSTTDGFASQTPTDWLRFSDLTTPRPDVDVYVSGHSYDYTRAGTGSPFSLRNNEADINLGDNSGSFTIQVFEYPGGSSAIAVDPCADIVGSINARNHFWWLAQNGTDMFLGRTADYFQSVQYTPAIANYLNTMQYGISTHSYNGNILLLTAGDPANSDSKVYISTNGGVSVSAEGTVLTAAGGAINVGYEYAAANAGNPPDFFANKGQSGGNTIGHSTDAGSHNIFAANKVIPQFGIGSLTISSLSMNAVATDGAIRTTDDGGLTWGTPATSFSADTNGWTGLPNRVDALLVFGDESLWISDDRATTKTDIYTGNYDTFRASAYGSGGTDIIWAQARMDLLYTGGAVTT